jgi:hypothetical protein
MKVFLSIILIFFFFKGFSQFKISDPLEFDIDPPKNISAYEIYYQSASAKKPSLHLRVDVSNGLKKKIVEFENGKVKLVQYNFYKDTLLEKAVLKYTDPKSTETFYYKYDSVTHEQVYAKGYTDNKLAYSYSAKRAQDTTIITEVFDYWWRKSNDKTCIIFSPDSLKKTVIEYTTNGISPRYSFSQYTGDHKLKFQIDSSSEGKGYIEFNAEGKVQKRFDSSTYGAFPYLHLYTYDSIGRLKKEQITSDTISKEFIEHFYSDTEQVDVGYIVYKDENKFLTFKTTTKFDSKGNEVFKEKVEYKENTAEKITNRTMSKKTYGKNRIVKFEEQNEYGYYTIHWVKYYDKK